MAQVNLKSLAKLVTVMDGYASLSSADPLKTEKLVREVVSSGQGRGKSKDSDPTAKEVSLLWSEVRKDVYNIANLPGSSEEIMKASKRVGIAKMLVPFLGAGVVLIFLVLSIFGVITMGAYARIEVIVLAIVAYNVSLFVFMIYNRRLSAKVAEYYKRHGGEVASQRKHVKSSVQKLINVLASRIRARDLDPNRLRFTLANTDYTNINVIGQDKSGTRNIVTVKS